MCAGLRAAAPQSRHQAHQVCKEIRSECRLQLPGCMPHWRKACPTFLALALMAGPLARAAGVRAAELLAGAPSSFFCRFCLGAFAATPAAVVVAAAAPALRLPACGCCGPAGEPAEQPAVNAQPWNHLMWSSTATFFRLLHMDCPCYAGCSSKHTHPAATLLLLWVGLEAGSQADLLRAQPPPSYRQHCLLRPWQQSLGSLRLLTQVA
jgi:hypothetical protein